MIVSYRTDSGVTFVRHVETVDAVDRELVAIAAMARLHRDQGHERALRNMYGLADELLTARWDLQLRDDLDVIRGAWWDLAGATEPSWPQSEEVGA